MRRFAASLLFGFLAWSSCAPLALAAFQDDLPACCRREGMHHCMAAVDHHMAEEDATARLHVQLPSCPFRVQTPIPTGVARQVDVAIAALYLGHSGFVDAREVLPISQSSCLSQRDRAPPLLLSSLT